MQRRASTFIIVAAAMLALSSATNLWACGGCQGGGFFPWFGYGGNGPAAYALGNIPAPPYFALHPPVYYSHITPRSYGRSPFAAPADSGVPATTPVRRSNPYLMAPAPTAAPQTEQAKPVKIAILPKRIVNPYYVPTLALQPN